MTLTDKVTNPTTLNPPLVTIPSTPMPTQHTPGPWEIVQDAPLNPKARFNIGSRIPSGFATYVCTVKTEKHLIRDGKEEANARLIAAAPELLSALQSLLEKAVALDQSPTHEGLNNCDALAKARAAIAKANNS
jgi:hypothetical protein